jgi:hypothetical protein
MSKPVHPTQIRPTRQERRRKQRDLREEQKRQGRQYPPTFTLPNRKSEYKTEDEEQEDIQQRTEKILDVYRHCLLLGQNLSPRPPAIITAWVMRSLSFPSCINLSLNVLWDSLIRV